MTNSKLNKIGISNMRVKLKLGVLVISFSKSQVSKILTVKCNEVHKNINFSLKTHCVVEALIYVPNLTLNIAHSIFSQYFS